MVKRKVLSRSIGRGIADFGGGRDQSAGWLLKGLANLRKQRAWGYHQCVHLCRFLQGQHFYTLEVKFLDIKFTVTLSKFSVDIFTSLGIRGNMNSFYNGHYVTTTQAIIFRIEKY